MRSLLRRRPLRVKISLLMVVLLSAGLLVSSFIATTALSGYLMDRVDEALSAGSRPLTSMAVPLVRVPPTDGQLRPPSRFSVAVVFADGRPTSFVSAADDNAADGPALPTVTDLAASAALGPLTVGPAAGSGDWRILATYVPEVEGWVVVGTPLADLQATVDRLVLLQLVVGVVVVVVAAGVGYVVVRRSLRPLDEISGVATTIAEGDLSQRVPARGESTEVDQLATAFNSMVTRIEESFDAQRASELQARDSEERMRQFVADASHELRTPLTSIRGYAELVQDGAAHDPDLALTRIQDEAWRMGLLVDDLLLLARLDEHRPLARSEVRLLDVVTSAVAAVAVSTADRRIDIDAGGAARDAIVIGDEARLRQVMDNLLSNAVRYSPEGTSVQVALAVRDGDRPEAVITVADHGPGLSPEEAAQVFDRLYRTDEARSRVRGGSGLGLAIVHSIVRSHGGTVSVSSTPGDGARFTVTLPLRG